MLHISLVCGCYCCRCFDFASIWNTCDLCDFACSMWNRCQSRSRLFSRFHSLWANKRMSHLNDKHSKHIVFRQKVCIKIIAAHMEVSQTIIINWVKYMILYVLYCTNTHRSSSGNETWLLWLGLVSWKYHTKTK